MGKRLGLVAWLAPLALAALVAAFGGRDPADIPYFAHASRTLFSSAWADTFADPSLQAGPVLLALVGPADRIGGLTFLAYVVEVGLAALFVGVVGRLLADRPGRVAAQTVAGVAVVALGLTADAFVYGHPAQMAVPLLWVLAGIDSRAGRTMRAGLLLGLAAGLEPWGLLGAPVLLLAPKARRALRGLAVQAGATAALYLPFVVAGDFRMFDYHWKVEGWTLVRVFLDPGSEFPWAFRLLQGGAALAAGAAVALLMRKSARAICAVPLVLVAVRLALDPTLYPWYWVGAETVIILAVAELATEVPERWQHWLRAPRWVLGERRS
jgi:hypothetical protein